MEVETILLQEILNSSDPNIKYRAIGIIVTDRKEGIKKYFTRKNFGEIILCCGTIQSPFLLSRSIILPSNYPIETIQEKVVGEIEGNDRNKNNQISQQFLQEMN